MPHSEQLSKVIDEVIAPAAPQVDREGKFPRDGLNALGSAGILGLTVPAEHGGGGVAMPSPSKRCTPKLPVRSRVVPARIQSPSPPMAKAAAESVLTPKYGGYNRPPVDGLSVVSIAPVTVL